ncbi:YezD family protein [Paenibacillus fonticola]|uniref:YezD family protein n=1 Tax=Paenibacillus fonticola TaxID=379896 RepID=UPI0003798B54|nr:YezD family protein [Paenibacillus fonticola]
MAKPLKVDDVWLDRIAGLLDEMEFGSLNIVVHEGQIVQVERTERKRYEIGASSSAKSSGNSRNAARALRQSGTR